MSRETDIPDNARSLTNRPTHRSLLEVEGHVRLTRSGLLLLWIGCLSGVPVRAQDTKEEPTYGAEMSLEDLLTTVVTASKRSQTLATAPAVMSVLTEQDIQM